MKIYIILFHFLVLSLFSCKGQNNNAKQLKPGDTIIKKDIGRIKIDSVTTKSAKKETITNQDFVSYTVDTRTKSITITNTGKTKLNYNQHLQKAKEQNQELVFALPVTNTKGKTGLLIKNGKLISPRKNKIDSLFTGVFLINNKGQIGMGLLSDFQDEKNPKNYKFVSEGGAFLFNNGDVNSIVTKDSKKRYLSAVGVTNNGAIVFGVSKKESTYDELLKFMVTQKKCTRVLLLNNEKSSYFSASEKKYSTQETNAPLFIVTQKIEEKPVEYAEETLTKNLKRITYLGKHYIVCTVTTKNQNVELFNQNKQGGVYNLQTVNKEINSRKKTHIFSMNAGMYDKQYNPIGLYVANGKEYHPVNLQKQGYGNFYSLPPNGIFVIDSKGKPEVISTQAFIKKYKPSMVKLATQSGPMMVINGKFNKAFNEGSSNLNIRNGIGVDENGNIVAVISEDEVNFYEFSALFKEKLKCNNALYLDGVVSQWYAPKLQEKTNSQYKLGTIITFFQ